MTLPPREFKDRVYEALARVAKAVASPHRLELLDLLAQGPRDVESLAGQIEQPIANTSQHLQVLKRARLVSASRSGQRVIYQLSDSSVHRLLRSLRVDGAGRLGEVDQLVRTQFSGVPMANLDLVHRGALVLDVRPSNEFAAGHLQGALSIPIGELRERLDELPEDRPIVAVCRGPFCVFAADAVTLLRESGREAYRLELGPSDWEALGLAVAS